MKMERNLVNGILAACLVLLLLTFALRKLNRSGISDLEITGVVAQRNRDTNFIILTISNRSDNEFILFWLNNEPRVSLWVEVNNVSSNISSGDGRAEEGIFKAHSKIVFTNQVPEGIDNIRYEITAHRIPRILSWLWRVKDKFDSSIFETISRPFLIDDENPVVAFSEKFKVNTLSSENRRSVE